MEKRTLYPKTSRFSREKGSIRITEKIDGSNLSFYKKDGELYIAQRNYIFSLPEIEEIKSKIYEGLYGWLKEYGAFLKSSLYENSVIIGEWIGMGKIKYDFKNRFMMFAKGNLDENLNLVKINYIQDYFIYPFIEKEIPSFISLVPTIKLLYVQPTLDELDKWYDEYTESERREIEGFIIAEPYNVKKYVRLKNGKLQEHHS